MDYQSTDQGSTKMWWIVGAIVIIALATWYYYAAKPSQTPVPSVSATADLSNEFSQIPDNAAALTQDQAASAAAVQGF